MFFNSRPNVKPGKRNRHDTDTRHNSYPVLASYVTSHDRVSRVRWFKHMTASHLDEKLSRLLDSSGLAGYGAWWLVLEIIAGEMGKDDPRCSVEHSLTRWSRLLDSHPNQVKKYLGSMQGAGLVDLECIERRYRVSVPNLLKYRDEYSKKSGHTPKSRRTNSSSESEAEIETESEPKSTTASYSDPKTTSDHPRSYLPPLTHQQEIIEKITGPLNGSGRR